MNSLLSVLLIRSPKETSSSASITGESHGATVVTVRYEVPEPVVIRPPPTVPSPNAEVGELVVD